MRRSTKLALVAGIAIAFAAIAAESAAALPAGPAVQAAAPDATAVSYYRRHHYRTYRPRYGYMPYPGLKRGFNDPGTAYHGNINGCAVDLGYGRWESCDVGR